MRKLIKKPTILIIILLTSASIYVGISKTDTEQSNDPISITIQKVNFNKPKNVISTFTIEKVPLNTTMRELKDMVPKSSHKQAQDPQLYWAFDIQLRWINQGETYDLDNEQKTVEDYIKEYHMREQYKPLPLRGIILQWLVKDL